MAAPTINSASLLCSAQGNAAGQVQWWLFNVDLADAQTAMDVSALKDAGPGSGQIIQVIDGGAADSGKGRLQLEGGSTGLITALDSTTEIKFTNTQTGADGAASEAITALDFIAVFAV